MDYEIIKYIVFYNNQKKEFYTEEDVLEFLEKYKKEKEDNDYPIVYQIKKAIY